MAPHNRPHSEGGQRQVGGALPDRLNGNDHGNGQGRFRWTEELKDDLLNCYESSEPARRGYMARLHVLWCDMHPEHRAFSQQQLRDQVSYLRRTGYVRAPRQPQLQQAATPPRQIPADGRHPLELTEVNLRARGNLNTRVPLKPQDLARMNASIDEDLPEDADIWQINSAVYNAARQILPRERLPATPSAVEKAKQRVHKIEAKIRSARQHASRIQSVVEYIVNGRPYTSKVRRIAAGLRRQHHTLNRTVLQTIKQHCLDRIRALMAIKKTLNRRVRSMEQNNLFHTNPARLFQEPQRVVENPPAVADVENFWKGIYETTRPFDRYTPAMAHFEALSNNIIGGEPNEVCPAISLDEIQQALAGAKNFAAPGPDGIVTWWWKKFPSTHRRLVRVFNSWLNEGQPIPDWFVEGRTVLIPKKGDLSDPSNYRPITCLNSCYKLFTRILYARTLRHVDPVFQEINEQRGAKKGMAGCKENLLIDRCIAQDSVQYKRNLSMAWVDYRKAFDTTSHELLLHLLKCLAVPAPIVRCIEQLFPLWRTRFTISSGDRRVSTEPVTFRRGVFQGDSLSPLLFCISLLPLSVGLRETRGYYCGPPNNRRHKVTHLFYMDDLKIYASGEGDLQNALRVVQEYTWAIGMEFGLDKCAVVHLKRGRSGEFPEDVQLVDGSILHHLDAGETYAYLGMAQRHIQDAKTIKDALRSKYRHLTRKIWSSELSGKNKVSATNMLAVPVLLYSFGVVKWAIEELRKLDRETRKMMHMHRSIHPRSSVPRVYLPRHRGGRGLLSLECMHGRMVLGIACKIFRSSDSLLRLVRDHEIAGVGAGLFKAAERAAGELGLVFDYRRGGRRVADPTSVIQLEPIRLKARIKAAEQEHLLRQHVDKPLHGVFFRNMETLGLSAKLTFSFLKSAGLKSETEGFILACQDGVINTLVYRSRVMGVEVPDTNCRTCQRAPESLMHLLAACPVYAISAYIHRHNAALRVLYYHLRHSYGIDQTPVLPYVPGDIESVVGNEKCRIYWNYSFPTVRQIQATKPDVVLLDQGDKVIYVIEFSAPAETNVALKEEEKRAKYRDLRYELQVLYPGYSTKMVVLIIGVLGGMKPTLLSELKTIPACRKSAEWLAGQMQKAVILGSLRLLRAHDSGTYSH